MTHVLEHVPATRGNAEGGEIAQINALLRAATKDVHGVVDNGGRVSLARDWNVANAVELRPRVGTRLVRPDIVEPRDTVCTTESSKG